ncbi:tetratricopeptide repeat protein, partial [Lactococcus petauri]|uniref:tetratricopeptide repeat protein n=1 Tax=Lactococcus petauri TaxID=1940789 RepID=UPI0034DAFD72
MDAPPAEEDGFAALTLGLSLARAGRLAEAEAPLRRALAALPERPEPHVHLGQIAG